MDLSRINWRKASYSSGNGGDCVEVGNALRVVAVRDSKDSHGPALTFSQSCWRAFTGRLRQPARPA